MTETGLNEIYYKPSFRNGTPARVNRATGNICITDKFLSYPENVKKFILFHEAGHFVKQTKSELEADNYAFEQYAKRGNSLTDGLAALTQVLNTESKKSRQRIAEQFKRSVNYDYFNNNNKKLKPFTDMRIFEKGTDRLTLENFEDFEDNFEDFDPIEYADFCADNELSPYSDMSRKEYREQKRQKKIEKKDAQNKKKQATAEAKVTKANAKKSLADQGIKPDSVGGQIGDALGGIVGGIFGKKKSADDTAGSEAAGAGAATNQDAAAGSSKKYLLYGGIAVAIIIIIVVVFMMMKKKGKK